MFRRIRWMALGALGGVAAAGWVAQRLRRPIPQQVASRLAGGARTVRRAGGAAWQEGVQAMRQREEDLRAQLSVGPRSRSSAPESGRVPARDPGTTTEGLNGAGRATPPG